MIKEDLLGSMYAPEAGTLYDGECCLCYC